MKVKASMKPRTKQKSKQGVPRKGRYEGMYLARRGGTLYVIPEDTAPVGKRAKIRQAKPRKKKKLRKY